VSTWWAVLRQLAISGGWLGHVVVTVAKTTGAWDPMVLSIIAIVWYQVVRSSAMEIALIFGFYLDAVIPLQYWRKFHRGPADRQTRKEYTRSTRIISMITGRSSLLQPSSSLGLISFSSLTHSLLWFVPSRSC
jgi:hypothetical protein